MSHGAEDRLHQWLRRRLLQCGFDRVGDDGAILPAGGPWVVSQDHQIEGVHFPSGLDPRVIAKRLLAVNLSDLAAMGAEPTYAFLALSCPADFDQRRFLTGFIAACQAVDVELAGGDLARHDRVTTSLTLMGLTVSGGRWLQRSLGRAGDSVWLAGDLGLSATGRRLLELGAHLEGRRVLLPEGLGFNSRERRLAVRAVRRHLVPVARIDVGRWLAKRRRVAAIDVSDGFALDLHRLCRNSGVGARIEADTLPLQQNLKTVCIKLGMQPLDTALSGGEDYALLFTLPPRVRPPVVLACRRIGQLTVEPDIFLDSESRSERLPALGWDHFSH